MSGKKKRKKRNYLKTSKAGIELIKHFESPPNRLMTCDEVKDKPNLKLIKKKIKLLATVIHDLLDDTDLNYIERFFARTAYMHLNVLRNSLHRHLKGKKSK